MEKRGLLELLEERIIFRTSRMFFSILATLALLAVIAGVLYLGAGAIRPSKDIVEKAPDAAPVGVTAADVRAEIELAEARAAEAKSRREAQAEGRRVSERTGSEPAPEVSVRDKARQKYGAILDTLESLLPATIYTWESKGGWRSDRWGYRREWMTTETGIFKRLETLTSGIENSAEIERALRGLCDVIRTFPEKERLEPLKIYVQIFQNRYSAYKSALVENEAVYQAKLAEAEAKYQVSLAEQKVRRYQGTVVAGSGIALVAFLAIFLVLLSMQRSLHRMEKGMSPVA
jgi:hypothetical protein